MANSLVGATFSLEVSIPFQGQNSAYLTSIRHTTYVLLSTVHQSGELETLLENNGVIPKIEEEAATATA